MAQYTVESLKQEPLCALHMPDDLINLLEPVNEHSSEEQVTSFPQLTKDQLENLQTRLEQQRARDLGDEDSASNLTCRTCHTQFDASDREGHRKHFATDWHRYNIKRKLDLNQAPVTLQEFEALLENLSESLSGSESESEETATAPDEDDVSNLIDKQLDLNDSEPSEQKPILTALQKKYSALVWYGVPSISKSLQIGVYGHLAPNRDALSDLQRPRANRLWSIIMIGGGHFAAGVIDVKQSARNPLDMSGKAVKMIAHKTFHRYTTRRKQGGAQSANDNAKGAANSAGAQIRRYNELKLQQEVREVLGQWKQHLIDSEFIFVHAPSNNRKVLFNYEDAVLNPRDNSRIKSVPFPTRRPTLNEIRRVFIELVSAKVIEIDYAAVESARQKALEKEAKARQQLEKSRMKKMTAHTESDHPPEISPELEKLLTLTKQGKEQLLLGHIRKHESTLLPSVRGTLSDVMVDDARRQPTLLHIASSLGHAQVVDMLIRDLDADPTIANDLNKTAYDVAKGKEVRTVFRRCMCDLPDRWAWRDAAHVPTPMTREAELEQIEKDRQRQAREEERRLKIENERRAREEARLAKEESERQQRKQEQRDKQRASAPLKSTTRTLGGSRATSTEMSMASMTPEARMRLEREMRARAAEERMRRLQQQ
ncbi:hypothetical protein BCR43DRAFT_563626 [Syncephalastrum racemosum]|uniref:VLRF1 domain-containing protein n=1 Tax=Syncephalastrum racemosum TaxID=13706 RepID=A0A1X2HBV5_SYNRA|nr:hypothetical protein BCR43DRAFT_563626 [Syncephalastrum racemosum]